MRQLSVFPGRRGRSGTAWLWLFYHDHFDQLDSVMPNPSEHSCCMTRPKEDIPRNWAPVIRTDNTAGCYSAVGARSADSSVAVITQVPAQWGIPHGTELPRGLPCGPASPAVIPICTRLHLPPFLISQHGRPPPPQTQTKEAYICSPEIPRNHLPPQSTFPP